MKKLIFLFFGLLLASCQNGERKPKGQTLVNEDFQVDFAKNIAHKLLVSQKDGGFYELTKEEATERMVAGLNEAVQKESYKRIKQAFGNYKNLELDTVFAIKEDQTYHVFRFKGEFEDNEKVEIRTVLNLEGKLAGFFVVPWKETL